MKPRFDLPVVDHHCHLRPGPIAREQVRRFVRAGGTHLFLTTQNYRDQPPSTLEDYQDQFETTVGLARQLREDFGLGVYVVLAPFPVDLVHVAPHLGLTKAEDLQDQALRLAARYIQEEKAVALGEVGRAHFPVPSDVGESLERVFDKALEIARDISCPVVLHTEDLTESTWSSLARRTRGVGLSPERVVKHYAREIVSASVREGLGVSYLAKRDLVRLALADEGPWFLETDYLDDPRRPGLVLPLDTVPRRVHWLLDHFPSPGSETGAAGLSPEEVRERLRIPFERAFAQVYHLALERPDGLAFPETPGSPRPPPAFPGGH